MHWVYHFGRGLARLLLCLLSRWRVKGRENLPRGGPYLIVCNHLHVADPPIVATSIKLPLVFMAKEELFQDRWSRFWVSHFGAFPVKRGGADREALRQAAVWLEKGVSLIMFPEGQRSRAGHLQPAFPGSAFVAARLNVPILPVSITGTEQLRRRGWWLRRPPITVTIGQPFRLPRTEGRLTRARLTELTDYIMERIAWILPADYRGAYGKKDEDG